jgi:hypothetical protein
MQMDLQKHIDQVIGVPGDHRTIQAARMLASCTDDHQVMDALCEAAVSTTSHKVREVLIDVLKTNPAGACRRFSDYALWSDHPSCRKWALVNLSLMACRSAKNAVISGLSDPDASVRKAAALNTGLYDDKDVLDAQERYFEKHRFGLTLSFIGDGIAALKTKSDRLDDAEYAIKAVDALRSNT